MIASPLARASTDLAALEARVREFVRQHVPSLAQSRTDVLAVSGGADSTAMTALLCETRIVEPSRCVVAHFDHCLRGADASARDRETVADLCARYGLPLVEGSWPDPRRSEAEARRARYVFLTDACRDAGSDTVVTGHTADDQVETVLMHAIRGAGLRGLSGMAAESRVPFAAPQGSQPLLLLRPLLNVSRTETRAYCAARRLRFVDDPTNEDRKFLRNRIRGDVIPALEEAAPDIRRLLIGLAETARCAAAILDRLAAPAILERAGTHVALSRPLLCTLPRPIASATCRLAVEALLGDTRDLGRRHYEEMIAAASAQTGSRFLLARGIELIVDAATVTLFVGPLPTCDIPPQFECPLPFVGPAGAWRLDIRCAGASVDADRAGAAFSATIHLPEGAVLRGWRPGDRITLPSGNHKKLQDVYVDRKVPRRDRHAAPVIAVGRDVIWTPLAPVPASPVGPSSGAPWLISWSQREPADESDLP